MLKVVVAGGSALALVGLFAALPYKNVDVPHRICVKYEKQQVITYPNLPYIALGPQYTALALIPAQSEENVCIEWKTVPANDSH